MGGEPFHGCHDLGDSGLVVCSQQGRAVGGYHSITQVIQKIGKFRGRKDNIVLEDDIVALVVFVDPGPDVFSRYVGGRIDMGHESDGGSTPAFRQVRREPGNQVTVIAEQDNGNTEIFTFLLQETEKIPLPRCRGQLFFIMRIRRRVYPDVPVQAFKDPLFNPGLIGFVHGPILQR